MTAWTKLWLFLALLAVLDNATGWCVFWLVLALISYRTVGR